MIKGIADIARDIDGLDFKRTKVKHLAAFIIGNEHHVNVAGQKAVAVLEPDFRQGCPRRTCRKEE